jgi:trehalose/maltose transport system permease protein
MATNSMSELRAERLRAARWFLLPMILALLLVAGWPLMRTIYFSFTNASLTDLYNAKFVGFNNYFKITTLKSGKVIYGGLLADPVWWNAVWNTVRFSVISVTIETMLGMIVALVLNADFKGRGLVRAAILVPWAIGRGCSMTSSASSMTSS